MNTRKTYFGIAVAGLGLAGLVGCKARGQPKLSPLIVPSVDNRSNYSITNGDFDSDSDLDIVAISPCGRFYFLENDGKGNFKLRENSYSAPTTQSK